MKTLLNPIIAVLLLSSTLLSAQSPERRIFYKHAATARAFLKEIEKFDSTSQFRNSDRTLDSTYVFERSDEGVLAHIARIMYQFDDSKRMKTVSQFELIGGQWFETIQAALSYHPSTNTVVTTIRSLDEETMVMVDFARNTETTRDDGQLLYHELALFFGFGYIPFESTALTYNAQGLADSILISNFDIELFELVPTVLQTHGYSSAAQLLFIQVEVFDIDSNVFSLSELVEYLSYDDKGSPLKITNSFWDAESETWVMFINFDFLYTYDNASRITRKTTYVSYLGEDPEIDIEEFEYHDTWGEVSVYTTSTMENGILVPLDRETFEFDNEGNLILETQISLQTTPETIVGRQQHFYDGFTSSVAKEKKLVFDIRYANPSRSGEVVHISVETTNIINLSIYDLQGKKVGDKSFRFAENFRLPSLPSGMYILVLQADGFKPESRKILIK